MATIKSVDDLSSVDRTLVVAALELKHASLVRAAKASSSDGVRSAYNAESALVSDLIAKFR